MFGWIWLIKILNKRIVKMCKIIDLTYDIEEGMTTFDSNWHPKVSITQIGRLNFEGRETRKITCGSHTGTHIDAPLHFINNGVSIEKISLNKLIGDVSIIDFSNLKKNDVVTADMLKKYSLKKKILFNFGWGKYWNCKKFYKDYPFFSIDAANYLVDFELDLIGMDTPSPDDSRIQLDGDMLGSSSDSPIHKIFLNNGIILLEYVANLDSIINLNNWNIVVMPLKIKGSDGAPARVCVYKED